MVWLWYAVGAAVLVTLRHRIEATIVVWATFRHSVGATLRFRTTLAKGLGLQQALKYIQLCAA